MEFFKKHGIKVEKLPAEKRVALWRRLQKVPIGEGVEEHLSAIY